MVKTMRKVKNNNNRSKEQKNNFACATHCFVHFLAVVLPD